jgi:hypothetical protein
MIIIELLVKHRVKTTIAVAIDGAEPITRRIKMQIPWRVIKERLHRIEKLSTSVRHLIHFFPSSSSSSS